MILELLILLITFLVTFLFYSHKRVKDKFRNGGLKFQPGYPIFGNTYGSIMGKKHMIDDLEVVYSAFPEERYVGYIESMQPIVLVRDPELMKSITTKDFDNFTDHRQFFSEEVDPLFAGSLIQLKGEKWRDMRTTLSPAFTGSKMRQMLPFMTEISQNIISYLKDTVTEDEEVDIGDLIRRYTNDVIASAGFGVNVNSVKEKDNQFFKLGQNLFIFDTWRWIKIFLCSQWPKLCKRLGIKSFPENITSFFTTLVKTTIDHREKNKVERPDMIQLLMEASKGKLRDTSNPNEKDSVGFATVNHQSFNTRDVSRKWTMDELAAQVFIFFAAGFESSGGTMIMAIHELALNPDIQEKLYQEVKEYKEKNNALAYETMEQLKYLDAVLNETMRKWAVAIIMDRTCTKEYELPPPRKGGKPYKLKPGDVVYNVVNCIHLDEKYWPDPKKFDPERFSDENKANIKPFTFMPFGMGPRSCIGSRFALMELKVLLFDLVSNFKIVKTPKTVDPIVLQPLDFNLKCVGGCHVRLEKRV